MSRAGIDEYCWTTRDGRTISVGELDDDHLRAIFEFIRRRHRFNYGIFDEMAMRGLWDADRAVLARVEFKNLHLPRTLNGTIFL